MTTKRVFSNDREEQQKEFLSTRIGKGASGKQPHAQKSSQPPRLKTLFRR